MQKRHIQKYSEAFKVYHLSFEQHTLLAVVFDRWNFWRIIIVRTNLCV